MENADRTVNVTVIPPTLNLSALSEGHVKVKKKRVAAYARVSTDDEEQLTSYKNQTGYYTDFIQSNPEWEFAGMYADEGVTGTNTKKRVEFNRMIEDAMAGKIDLIITKSVSRFARNTVDSLVTIRKLKEKGIEIYFEKENIYTLDSKGEFLITIMSSIAQEESRSISENVTWGKRKGFKDGNISLGYKHFLGLAKGEDGRPRVVEEEARIVRLIYKLFMQDMSPKAIAAYLTANNIPTPSGKHKWYHKVVESILTNEKYKGDAILQKTFVVDYLTHKVKKNEGEVPRYYVKNSHEAIIDPELFDIVQYELKRRKESGRYAFSTHCFTSKIRCGQCGAFYGSRVLHAGTKYERLVWQCASRFTRGASCSSKNLTTEVLEQAFLTAFNSLVDNKDEIIQVLRQFVRENLQTRHLDQEIDCLKDEVDVVFEILRACIEENAQETLEQGEYRRKYDAHAARYETLQAKRNELIAERDTLRAKKYKIERFIDELKAQKELVTSFSREMWYATVDHVVITKDDEAVVRFKGGNEVRVRFGNMSKCGEL